MSTKIEHTPGPWQARFIYRMIRAAREAPGLLMESDPSGDWADAQLMAASPRLLAAAVGAAHLLLLHGFDDSDELNALLDAIAEARGMDVNNDDLFEGIE